MSKALANVTSLLALLYFQFQLIAALRPPVLLLLILNTEMINALKALLLFLKKIRPASFGTTKAERLSKVRLVCNRAGTKYWNLYRCLQQRVISW